MEIEEDDDVCHYCGESFFTLDGYDCSFGCGDVFCSYSCLAAHEEGAEGGESC